MSLNKFFATAALPAAARTVENTAFANQAKAQRHQNNRRLRRLILGLSIAALAGLPARSTILFRPVGNPPEVFTYKGAPISKPLTGTKALNSPKVYFIFVGPNFEQKGKPVATTNSMIARAKTLLKSSYLSGLTQYGSDGHAEFAAVAYDTKVDPTDPSVDAPNLAWTESDKFLSNPAYSSWLPPSGDARTSPIYVVVHYNNSGKNIGGNYAGWNDYGPNSHTTRAINAVNMGLTSSDQVDEFTWLLSHELAERISTGTGDLIEVSPHPGGQICDGEPEGSNYYAWRIGGSNGPVVTSYWSFLDQAFIIPDGNLNRVLFVPVWNSNKWAGKFLSLQQGTLYEITAPGTRTVIDTSVQSFVVNLTGGTAQIFDLTSSGEVKQYSGSGEVWTTVSPAHTVASALASTNFLEQTGTNSYTLADGGLFMLAGKQVSFYSGAGTSWSLLSGSSVTATAMVDANGNLFQNTNSAGVYRYSDVPGFAASGGTVTGTGPGTATAVQSMVSAGGFLYLLAIDPAISAMPGVYRYDEGSSLLKHVTDSATFVYSIVTAGDSLCMLATGPEVTGAIGVSQYDPASNAWLPLTGTNTAVSQILVQDGSELYIVAANTGTPAQVWQYSTPGNWTELTGTNTSIKSVTVSTDNHLHMVASDTGGPIQNYLYSGTPGDWTVSK